MFSKPFELLAMSIALVLGTVMIAKTSSTFLYNRPQNLTDHNTIDAYSGDIFEEREYQFIDLLLMSLTTDGYMEESIEVSSCDGTTSKMYNFDTIYKGNRTANTLKMYSDWDKSFTDTLTMEMLTEGALGGSYVFNS